MKVVVYYKIETYVSTALGPLSDCHLLAGRQVVTVVVPPMWCGIFHHLTGSCRFVAGSILCGHII